MSFARVRVRMRTVFVTASHVLSVRNCWESVCGSMVLGVSSIPLIRMGHALLLVGYISLRISGRKSKTLFFNKYPSRKMVLAIKQNCFVCFECRICPPLSYGCCHFDICVVCLTKWNDINRGILRCPVCREIQFEKPLQFFCLKCRQPTLHQKVIWIQILLGQLLFILILLEFNKIK